MSPPIACARRFEIASPSPVPPGWRAIVIELCSNSWNICEMNSAGRPTPVSVTLIAISQSPPDLPVSGANETQTPMPPVSVNLIAFDSKLSTI